MPASAGNHVRKHCLGDGDCAEVVDLHDFTVKPQRCLNQQRPLAYPPDIEKHVDPAFLPGYPINQVFDAGGI